MLRSGGVGVAPAWGKANLTTDVTGTLPVANGGTGQTTASAAFDALKQAATYLTTGVVELANTAEVQAGTDTSRAITPADFRQGALVQGTVQNSTSGTVVDFTGIPSWAKRIIVMLFGVSTNGSTRMVVQIGTASGIETAGYFSNASYGGATSGMYTTNTTGYVLEPTGAASAGYTRYGSIVIENFNGNTWVSRSCISCYGGDVTSAGAGGKTLSATLDRVRVTTVAAGDTFDAGQINIMYE